MEFRIKGNTKNKIVEVFLEEYPDLKGAVALKMVTDSGGSLYLAVLKPNGAIVLCSGVHGSGLKVSPTGQLAVEGF